jgi:hypothetical protein
MLMLQMYPESQGILRNGDNSGLVKKNNEY